MKTKTFAQQLRKIRKRTGTTQEELAEKLNISSKTVQRWEWGERTPRMEEVKKIAEVLHVSEAELLNEPQGEEIKLTLSFSSS